MADDQDTNRYFSGGIYRILSGLFGIALTCLGIYVIFFGVVDPLVRTGAGLLIALLGVDAVWSAVQSRQSWLAKFVPFV